MNNFKEWLSDYLRYFLLILAAVLTIALVVIGVRVYQGMTNPAVGDADSIEILTEKETETVSETEAVTETELETVSETETVNESDAVSSEKTVAEENESADASESIETSDSTVNSKESTGGLATGAAAIAGIDTTGSNSAATDTTVSQEPETEVLIEIETEPATEAVYEPVYKTLKGSCYIRSGPSMDAEIIGEYMYGTTVEFLEDVGGWYKVQIDGMVGYMGARFF